MPLYDILSKGIRSQPDSISRKAPWRFIIMSIVRFENVTKAFGGKPVLDTVSLRIEEGERIGLIGRNGTGKSTIFRLITGEIEPDSGVIERMRRARIACLAQMPVLNPGDTIFDVVMHSFHDLIEMEHELGRLEHDIAAGDETLLERYSHIQDEFTARGGYEFRTKTKRVLHGLGFTTEDFKLHAMALSGGQRTRLMLALVLLQDADLLLLDEPENHLDIEAREWLEGFLTTTQQAVVIISHDRRMLNKIMGRMLDLERGQITAFTGNYESFALQKAVLREQQQKAFDAQREFIEKEQRLIERFRYKNTKASFVQSRIKRLEKMERVDAPPPEAAEARFGFGEVVRSGQMVLRAEEIGMIYGSLCLYKHFSFEATRGERIGIIGPNGSGKTTLLRHLAGRLQHEGAQGKITVGHKVQLGFYEQQHESLNRTNDILGEIRSHRPDLTPEQIRTFMGRFLFVGEDIFKPVSALSGGELSRVAMAKLILGKANLLLLDEPTNHLDIASREAIEGALSDFPGTLIVVSHDRELIDKLVDKLIVVERGEATLHLGNYAEYALKLEQRRTGAEPIISKAQRETDEVLRIRRDTPVRDEKAERSAQRTAQRNEEKEARKKRKQLEELEKNIESMEHLIEEMESRFTQIDPADFETARSLKDEYDSMKADLKDMYVEWETLAE